MPNTSLNISASLEQLALPLDAMHLAQLSAFAFSIPQLYFCREYLQLDEKITHSKCLQRLQSGLNNEVFTVEKLTDYLVDKEYFSAEEVRSRLSPEPDFELLSQ